LKKDESVLRLDEMTIRTTKICGIEKVLFRLEDEYQILLSKRNIILLKWKEGIPI